MLHQQIVVGLFQKLGTVGGIVLFEECFEAGGNAGFFGNTGDTFGKVHHATAFFQAELSQQEEGFAWGGGYPVGVTAPGIQHGAGGFLQAFVGHINETVLQLERADGLHFLFKILGIHIVKFKFVLYHFFEGDKLIFGVQETNFLHRGD